MTAAHPTPHYLDRKHLDRFEALQARLPLLMGERLIAVTAARWAPYGDGTLGVSSQRLIFLDQPLIDDSVLIMIRSVSYASIQRVDLELDTRDATQPHDIIRIVLWGSGELGPSEIMLDLPTLVDGSEGHGGIARTVSLPIYQHLLTQLVGGDAHAVGKSAGDSKIPDQAKRMGPRRSLSQK